MLKKSLIVSLIAVVFCVSGMAQPAGLQKHIDTEAKFSIMYPAEWPKETNKDGANVVFTAPDQTAVVQVQLQVTDGEVNENFTAMAVLLEAEKQLKYTNLLPENQRTMKPAQLKMFGAQEGAIGSYKTTTEEGMMIVQEIIVMLNGKNVYSLIKTIQEAALPQHGKTIDNMLKSFRIMK
jgi:hypothetical protein